MDHDTGRQGGDVGTPAPATPQRAGSAAGAAAPTGGWLSEEQQEAWKAVFGLASLLPGPLDAQLQRDSGLSLFEYSVLSSLSMTPGRSARMSALARRSSGSLTRLSNVVRKLEGRGLVRRSPDPSDGRFTVVQQDPEGAGAPLRVDVAAGQTTGSVEVPYTADDVYSGPPRRTFLQAFAVRNVGIDDGDGAAVVVDDEQRPTLTVSAPASVREGDPVEVTVTLSAPVGYEPYLTLGFAKPTSAPRATLGDLPRDWARRRLGVGGTRASSPLWGHGWSLGSSFGPGRTTARFTVPTARDQVREGSERVRLHVRLPEWGQFSDRTVLLRDR